jgi:hypothetical protein
MLCSCIHKRENDKRGLDQRRRQSPRRITTFAPSSRSREQCFRFGVTESGHVVRSCSSNLRVVVLIRPDEANLAIARGEAVLILAGLAEDPVRPLPRTARDRRRGGRSWEEGAGRTRLRRTGRRPWPWRCGKSMAGKWI